MLICKTPPIVDFSRKGLKGVVVNLENLDESLDD